jgi:hypothetical protein
MESALPAKNEFLNTRPLFRATQNRDKPGSDTGRDFAQASPWPNAGGVGEWGHGVRRFAPGCGVTGGTSCRPVGASGAIPGDSDSQAVGLGWHGTVPSGLRRIGSP